MTYHDKSNRQGIDVRAFFEGINTPAFTRGDPEERTLVGNRLRDAIEGPREEDREKFIKHCTWTVERCSAFAGQMAESWKRSDHSRLAAEAKAEQMMYEYFREHHPALPTFGDIITALEARQIDLDKISEWLDQGLFFANNLSRAVRIGYPEHAAAMDRAVEVFRELHESPLEALRGAAKLLDKIDR